VTLFRGVAQPGGATVHRTRRLLGSIEYAVTVLNVPLIGRAGHMKACGRGQGDACQAIDGRPSCPGGYVARTLVERVHAVDSVGPPRRVDQGDEFEGQATSNENRRAARRPFDRPSPIGSTGERWRFRPGSDPYQRWPTGRVGVLRDHLGDIGERLTPDREEAPACRRLFAAVDPHLDVPAHRYRHGLDGTGDRDRHGGKRKFSESGRWRRSAAGATFFAFETRKSLTSDGRIAAPTPAAQVFSQLVASGAGGPTRVD